MAISVAAAGIRELQTMSLATNYHRWTYDVVRLAIGQRVLEVGGGLGSWSHLLQQRERLVTIDCDPDCTQLLRERFADAATVRVLDADILDPALPLALAAERLDTVVCINVLEHIEDDQRALRHMYQALQPGGRLILLVPAHPRLYGTLDEVVGHFRRYERAGLREQVRDAGFSVQDCRYFNSVGAAGRYVIGRVRQQQETGAGQVRFYDRFVVPVLSRIERLAPPPFGQSLIVIGGK